MSPNSANNSTKILVLFLLFCFPACAFANAGTPLMWAGMLHLSIGNAVIGFAEGVAICLWFGGGLVRNILFMILANYVSAFAGFLFLKASENWLRPDLHTAWHLLWLMVFATFCLTLLLEWPFVALCLFKEKGWKKKSVKATLVTQTASYALMIGFYWSASAVSLYTNAKVVGVPDIAPPKDVVAYYIGDKDGDVHMMNFSNPEKVGKVFDLKSTNENDRLFVKPSESTEGYWDLFARLENDDKGNPRLVKILADVSKEAVPFPADHPSGTKYRGTFMNMGCVSRLGNAEKSKRKFWCGFWPVEGICMESSEGNPARRRFSWETPFSSWFARNATHLPGDLVLFQLGRDQICLLDAPGGKIALLAKGRGPVAVIRK